MYARHVQGFIAVDITYPGQKTLVAKKEFNRRLTPIEPLFQQCNCETISKRLRPELTHHLFFIDHEPDGAKAADIDKTQC
jgi:hypothetical protein